MAFLKGTSGNPGRRPKVVAEFRAACQDNWQEVLATWVTVMRESPDPFARMTAAEKIAHYAFGKPTQAIAVDDQDNGALTLAELIRRGAEA